MNTTPDDQEQHDEDPRPEVLRDPSLAWVSEDTYEEFHRSTDIPRGEGSIVQRHDDGSFTVHKCPESGMRSVANEGTFTVREVGEEHAIYFHNPNISKTGEWRDGQEQER